MTFLQKTPVGFFLKSHQLPELGILISIHRQIPATKVPEEAMRKSRTMGRQKTRDRTGRNQTQKPTGITTKKVAPENQTAANAAHHSTRSQTVTELLKNIISRKLQEMSKAPLSYQWYPRIRSA